MSASPTETHRPNVVRIAQGYADLGFTVYATSGTGGIIKEAGIEVNILPKLASGQRSNVIDLMKNKDMAFVINMPSGKNPREDKVKIRTAAMQNRIPIMTTLRGADAALRAIKSLQGSKVQVRACRSIKVNTQATNRSDRISQVDDTLKIFNCFRNHVPPTAPPPTSMKLIITEGLQDPAEFKMIERGEMIQISHFSYFDRDTGETQDMTLEFKNADLEQALTNLLAKGKSEVAGPYGSLRMELRSPTTVKFTFINQGGLNSFEMQTLGFRLE